jgi:hypothetical protein
MTTPARLKGQEIYVFIVIDDKLEDRLGPFLDLDVTLRKEVIEAEYLGESTTAFDSVFKGCQLALKGHMRGAHWLKMIDQDVRRARNMTGGVLRIDLNATVVFPGGKIVNWTFRDLQCGDHKITIADRKSYVECTLDAYCSEQPNLPKI